VCLFWFAVAAGSLMGRERSPPRTRPTFLLIDKLMRLRMGNCTKTQLELIRARVVREQFLPSRLTQALRRLVMNRASRVPMAQLRSTMGRAN